MNLSSAQSNALSGLSASARGANLVSTNISNTLTDGYAARELSQSTRSLGGVQIDGVQRRVDLALLADRRIADASLANADLKSSYLTRLQGLSGTPDQAGSLTALLADFEATLIEASSRPDAEIRLQAVVTSAQAISQKINANADGIQALRAEIDQQIDAQTTQLNRSLAQVSDLNKSIVKANARAQDTSSLEDQRQRLIDQISEIVPLKQLPRKLGAVALYATGGAVLLDSSALSLDFSPSNTVTADSTLANGQLSGLSVDGIAFSSAETGRFGGGSLTALFELRDETLVTAQRQLDTVAQDLAGRFETGLDPSLGVGSPGLFTEAGAVTSTLTGLASRLAVNPLVTPQTGGEVWRLRDGLGAAAPGDVGNADLLNAMLDILAQTQAAPNISLGASEKTSIEIANAFLSSIAIQVYNGENTQSYHSARQAALREAELANGVDTDQELQKLMLIEQTYAANAKMIQAVDDMLEILMGIA